MFGQFFLLGGLLGFVLYTRMKTTLWLIVSGLAWGLAFACRYNLAISIAVFLLFALFWFWRDKAAASTASRLAFILAPLMLCLLALGLYNLARFHDPLETGMTYQLTIPEFREISYSTAYVPSGLYAYLLYPLTGSPAFPFIQSAHFRPRLLPRSLFVPAGREFDQITFGLLDSVPAMWLFLLAVPLIFVILMWRGPRSISHASLSASPGFVFLHAGRQRGGSIRVPPGVLLRRRALSCRFLRAGRDLPRDCHLERAFRSAAGPCPAMALWVIVFALAIWTAAIGYFACFGVPVLVSLYYDPQMLANLAAFWNQGQSALRFLVPGGV